MYCYQLLQHLLWHILHVLSKSFLVLSLLPNELIDDKAKQKYCLIVLIRLTVILKI